jgi:Meiotically Up-regulated Gene 113 (MUG113) protein
MNKAHIINEIRRTARDGVPLGVARFATETGIRPPDWEKHWARFGDAQREAGFEPNQKQEAFDENNLLNTLAKSVSALGKFPTKREWRLKQRELGLPNEKTMTRRFGSPQDIKRRLKSYCQQNGGYPDVIALCASFDLEPAPKVDAKLQKVAFGYVYLRKWGRNYKIGKTNHAGRRDRELAIQLPEEGTMVHVIKTDDPSGIEDYWHRRFASKRKHGEWFELAHADIQAFCRRKFM